jgi:DNA-binding FadR family transcriptional regulator
MVQTLEIGRIKRTSASELAMNSILDLIQRGVLRPGDPLPSQRDLVVRMGLSRAALREGLSALSSLGVLEISHGRTTFVRKKELERLLRQMERAVASGEKPLGHSAAFHLAISKATHNPVLIDVVRPFIRLISRASDTIAAKAPASREREYRVHAELYESMVARDAEEARRRMRRHLEVARDAILEAFPQHEDQSAGLLFGRERP